MILALFRVVSCLCMYEYDRLSDRNGVDGDIHRLLSRRPLSRHRTRFIAESLPGSRSDENSAELELERSGCDYGKLFRDNRKVSEKFRMA